MTTIFRHRRSAGLATYATCFVAIALASPADASPVVKEQTGYPPPCSTGQVTVSTDIVQSASTHGAVRLAFSLTSTADTELCVLQGYPGVDTGTGGPLLHAERRPRGYMGGLPAGTDELPVVTLSRNARAYAVVEGTGVDAQGNQCPTYTTLLVTPPDTTEAVAIAAEIDACAVVVHPVTGG